MLDKIRLATPEEVAVIEPYSNLTPMCRVLKMGDMTAVWRVANELDPMLFGNGRLASGNGCKFLWGIENIMRGSGVTEYYFAIPADDTTYQHAVEEHFGAQRLSKQPDYRYRINL